MEELGGATENMTLENVTPDMRDGEWDESDMNVIQALYSLPIRHIARGNCHTTLSSCPNEFI